MCFSSGGEHLSATESTLHVRSDAVLEDVTLEMEVRGSLLVVLLLRGELLVFDWKRGQTMAVSIISIGSNSIIIK